MGVLELYLRHTTRRSCEVRVEGGQVDEEALFWLKVDEEALFWLKVIECSSM